MSRQEFLLNELNIIWQEVARAYTERYEMEIQLIIETIVEHQNGLRIDELDFHLRLGRPANCTNEERDAWFLHLGNILNHMVEHEFISCDNGVFSA